MTLADKIEAASGPSRELDAEIDRLFHSRPKNGDFDAAEQAIWQVEKAWSGLLVRSDGFARGSFCVPAYTASLDAALSLAPEGWKLRQMNFSAPCADDRKWHLNLYGGREGEDTFVGRGTSPALALVAAALRAGDTDDVGRQSKEAE